MATITKTYKETKSSPAPATHTVVYTGTDITVSGSTFTFTTPSIKAKHNSTSRKRMIDWIDIYRFRIDGINVDDDWHSYSCGGTTATNTYRTLTKEGTNHSLKLNTSSFFKASNSTKRTLNVTSYGCAIDLATENDSGGNGYNYESNTANIGTFFTITLNAPPTFTSSGVSIDTPGYIYAGLSKASVNVSSLSAKYGGTIKTNGVVFKIGNQTATRSNNGVLEIALNSAGTFTPTLSVTDSRGQVTTKSLSPITVKSYSAPIVSFNLDRIDENGDESDEGKEAVAEANITWISDIADLMAPTVTIEDEEGTAVTADVVWYKDRARTIEILDFSELSPSDMPIYAFIGNAVHDVFDTQKTYRIGITPIDSIMSGSKNSQTLPWAFYTIDFLAGGHGITFGKPAKNEGFECYMSAKFEDVIRALSYSYERDTGGTSNTGITFADKNNDDIAYMKAYTESNGQGGYVEGFNAGTYRDVSGNRIWNSLRLTIDPSGNPLVVLTQPKAWRTGLGLNSFIITDTFYIEDIEINANSISGNKTKNVAKTGYTPLMIQVNLVNATNSGQNVSGCNAYLQNLNGNTVTINIANRFTSAAKVRAIITVLYRAN